MIMTILLLILLVQLIRIAVEKNRQRKIKRISQEIKKQELSYNPKADKKYTQGEFDE